MKKDKKPTLFTRIDNPIARKLVKQFSEQYADGVDSITIDKQKLMKNLAKEFKGALLDTALGKLDPETFVRKSYEQMPAYDNGYFEIDGLGFFGQKRMFGIFQETYDEFMQGAVRTPGEADLHYKGYERQLSVPLSSYEYRGHSVTDIKPSKNSYSLLFES